MTTFQQDDRSVEGSAPIELYTFTSQRLVDPVIARSTSYHRDVVYGGFTFTARPIRRGAAAIENLAASSNPTDMTVEVDLRDPAADFWFTLDVPPQNFRIEIVRLQQTSGEVVDVYEGLVAECRASNRTAVFTIAHPLDDGLSTTLPGWQVSRRCQRTLFDTGCGLDRDASDIPTTLTTIFADPKDLHVAAVGPYGGIGGYDEGEFTYGELLHLPSGERRTIAVATPTRFLRLNVRLPSTAQVGDAVLVWRGCDKKATTCRDRFANIVNFGGCNQLPRSRRSIFDRDVGILRQDPGRSGLP